MSFSSHYLRCEEREIHYTEWGAQHDEVVIAWHGLARTCRDMDDIAEHLSQRWRVICPDTIGRGLSQWAADPSREYCLAFYARLATSLVNQLKLERFHWLGTSMGGAIGTQAAAGPLRGRIQRLVLNDNGPQLAAPAIERIRSYAGQPAAFGTVTELEQYFRTIYKPYGWLSDAQWRRLTETSTRRVARGPRAPPYHPAEGGPFTQYPGAHTPWAGGGTPGRAGACPRGGGAAPRPGGSPARTGPGGAGAPAAVHAGGAARFRSAAGQLRRVLSTGRACRVGARRSTQCRAAISPRVHREARDLARGAEPARPRAPLAQPGLCDRTGGGGPPERRPGHRRRRGRPRAGRAAPMVQADACAGLERGRRAHRAGALVAGIGQR